jgi:hypothetical protein
MGRFEIWVNERTQVENDVASASAIKTVAIRERWRSAKQAEQKQQSNPMAPTHNTKPRAFSS